MVLSQRKKNVSIWSIGNGKHRCHASSRFNSRQNNRINLPNNQYFRNFSSTHSTQTCTTIMIGYIWIFFRVHSKFFLMNQQIKEEVLKYFFSFFLSKVRIYVKFNDVLNLLTHPSSYCTAHRVLLRLTRHFYEAHHQNGNL